MQSISYITTFTSYITGFAAAGIIFSCVISAYDAYINGTDYKEVFVKLGKRLRAGVILILITAIINFLKGYWL